MSSQRKNFRLLVVLLVEGCAACQNFKEKYEDVLRELIIEQGDVSLSRVPYIRDPKGGEEIIVSASDGGTSYVHPQLSSFVIGYPTFILVDDEKYKDRTSNLDPYVFNRVIKGGKYTFGGELHSPANIVKWTKEIVRADEKLADTPSRDSKRLIRNQISHCKRNSRFCPTIVD